MKRLVRVVSKVRVVSLEMDAVKDAEQSLSWEPSTLQSTKLISHSSFWHLTEFCLSHKSRISFSRAVIYSVSHTRSRQMTRCTRQHRLARSSSIVLRRQTNMKISKTPAVTLPISALSLQVTHIFFGGG